MKWQKSDYVYKYARVGRTYIEKYGLRKEYLNPKSHRNDALVYRTAGFGSKEGKELRDKVIKDLKKQGYD